MHRTINEVHRVNLVKKVLNLKEFIYLKSLVELFSKAVAKIV